MRWKGLLIAAMIAIAAAPLTSRASHCADIYVWTGPFGGELPVSPTASSGRPNIGSLGCQPEVHVQLNLITPGATFVQIGAEGTAAQPASNGTIQFNGEPIQAVEWTHNGSRWVSPVMPIPPGTTHITAAGTTTNSGAAVNHTVFYKVVGT